MELIIPKKLKKGDKVVLLTPSGKAPEELIAGTKHALEELGLNVVVDEQNYLTNDVNGYYAGTDQERVDALHAAFTDESVRGIFAVRGGSGAFRIMDKLDYELIRNNPKVFVGMSDITAFQSAILRHAGLEVYQGPVFLHLMGKEKQFALENLKRILFAGEDEINLDIDEVIQKPTAMAEGVLVGGSLTIMGLIPNNYWYTLEDDIILLLEDVGEACYRMDRNLAAMRLTGKLDNLKAVIVGQNIYGTDHNYTAPFEVTLLDYFSNKNIPVVSGAKFGHLDCHLTLPIGRKVKLDVQNNIAKLII